MKKQMWSVTQVDIREVRIDRIPGLEHINENLFEFKLDDDDTALSQIKQKAHFKKYLQSSKKITLIGVNFDSEKGQLIDWQTCSRLPDRNDQICIVSKSNIPATVDIKKASFSNYVRNKRLFFAETGIIPFH